MNVTGRPERSSSRSAWTALERVSSWRRAAAWASGAAWSGRTGGLLLLFLAVGFEGSDDLVEVAGDLPVHLGGAGVAVRFGGGDDLQGGLPLGMVLREELRGRDEPRACQTRVCMRTGLDQRQLAVAVRQRLRRPGQLLFRPGGVAERPVRADRDRLPGSIDLAGFFPVLADGLVRQPGVMRGHLGRVVIEDFLHDMLGDVTVDQDRPEGVPPLVGCQVHGLAVLVADVAVFQPAVEGLAIGAAADRAGPADVGVRPGEQHGGAFGPAEPDAV